MQDILSASWTGDAAGDDNTALPPPWDGEVDIADERTESELMALKNNDPRLALEILRKVFSQAEARGDARTSLHALYLACITLYDRSQRALSDQMYDVIRERARGIGVSLLSTRIDLHHARRLIDDGEDAQSMVLHQRILAESMAWGHARLTFNTLGNLAILANHAGDAELVLSLCQQQVPLLTDDDVVIAGQRSHHANNIALALMKIAQAHEAAGDRAAARAALLRAREQALLGCERAVRDTVTLFCLETLVQILLQLDEAGEARTQLDRWTERLEGMPSFGSEDWCLLELARTRVELYEGRVATPTLEKLQVVEASTAQLSSGHGLLSEIRDVLLLAQEQMGHHEHALATHKRATAWRAHRQSALSRQHLKTLRHTVLAMRAEATEFIAHDLLTPLAAARTWAQAIDAQQLPPSCAPLLRDAQTRLDHARALSDQYLGLLRAELMPRAQFQVLDFGALADDVCESAVPAACWGVRLVRTIDIGTPIWGDAVLLTRALTALLADAFSRAPMGTRVELHLARDTAQGQAVLSIEHQGTGPTPSVRARVYQQSFGGHALDVDSLGLALAAKVCRLHRMRLRFDAVRGGSSRLRLTVQTAATAP
jgi:signal transduction histidine kinase